MLFNLFKRNKGYVDLSADKFREALITDSNFVVLDVRTSEEFKAGHIKDARKADFLSGEFAAKVDTMDKEKTYYVYCRSGARSAMACKQLTKAGFTKVFNLSGGYSSWLR
ncbi:rhodanese-like domain-containing protein [Cytophagaceae bacterium DM2B3-1]|uniref:Rhodanese-like domain-containing protein n=1 Tax=Xanthocytophaga flava TaxID=3048013 RepID=A0ABT7CRB1_9BACT|nr:rhodanese-like domain-containing protein [Xanthocytophaga flavus]MDJ1496289.1 rhodanese-like domain-containing protein [Xanthocytophaga flavus]